MLSVNELGKTNSIIRQIHGMRDQALARPVRHQDETVELPSYIARHGLHSTKCDLQTLEHPFFSLLKCRDTTTYKQTYKIKEAGKSKLIKIEVEPTIYGRPTIYDKDILTYSSAIVAASEHPMRKFRFIALDYFKATKKTQADRAGKALYEALELGLKRLRGSTITTNIPVNGYTCTEGFSWITDYNFIREEKTNRMKYVEITLSEYLFDAILAGQILTLPMAYYAIKTPFVKRMYELCRKHVGDQNFDIKFSYEKLHSKHGAACNSKEFMRKTRTLIENNKMPHYEVKEKKDERLFIMRKRPEQLLLLSA